MNNSVGTRRGCDVSIVVPVFNRASLLRWPLASLAAQTVIPFEVIVVDDGSSPGEASKIHSIVHDFGRRINCRLVVNDRNRGLPYARNRGLQEVRSAYVAFLDSDDLWMPEKLERQMRLIAEAKAGSSKPIFSATGIYRVDSTGTILHCKSCETRFDAARILKSNYIHPSSILLETAIAREIGGFADDVSITEDWDFFIRLVDRVRFAGLPDPLTLVVDHQVDRLSQKNKKTLRAMLLLRRKHMAGMALTRQNSGFCRNIATELQAHGKPRTATKFYIRSIALKYPDGLPRRLMEAWLSVYFRVAKTPSLQEKRRSFYLAKPKKQRRQAARKIQWDQDQEVIRELMRAV